MTDQDGSMELGFQRDGDEEGEDEEEESSK